MEPATVAIIVSLITAIGGAIGGWRLWLDSRANRRVQDANFSLKEWGELLDAHKALKKELEAQKEDLLAQLAENREEIATLKAQLAAMEVRYAEERAAWFKERRALEQRIASLERENTQLREKLDTLEAQTHHQGA